MTPEGRSVTAARLALGLLPLALVAGLVAWLIRTGPAESLSGANVPPVEKLVIERARVAADGFLLDVLNDGADPVTIAQVVVDDAFWQFEASLSGPIPHLGRTTIRIPYPWVHGEPHVIRLVTGTGLTFDHTIGVAIETPRPSWRTAGVFALIGVYVGVLPVALGLLWYPLMRRVGRTGLDFALALTIGLLAFLLVDASSDGLEAAARLPDSFQGVALLAFSAGAAYLALEGLGAWMAARRSRAGASAGWRLALLVAVGIGLHNFGEGLAIGAAFSLGELALGVLLIVGFTLHNTTEGLAIVAPLAREEGASRATLGQLALLGIVGGAPTIAGAWLGGLGARPIWSVVMLGLGVGAIAQVSWLLLGQLAGDRRLVSRLASGPIVAGLACGVLVMYLTGLLVG